MHRIQSMLLDAAIASVMLVPLFLLLNRYYFRSKVRTFCYFIFAIYLCGMFSVVGLPDIRYVRYDPHFNFVPFAYMFSDALNSLLNVALFVPMGFCLPLFWKAFAQLRKTLLYGFGVSLLIEILQIFTYRASDVNDLITNTTGTLFGWCIAKIILRLFSLQTGNHHKELAIISMSAFGVMFFSHPFLENCVTILFQ